MRGGKSWGVAERLVFVLRERSGVRERLRGRGRGRGRERGRRGEGSEGSWSCSSSSSSSCVSREVASVA